MMIFYWVFTFLPVLLLGQDPEPLPSPEAETSRFMYEFIKMIVILGGMVGILLFLSWYSKRMTAQKFEKGNDDSYIKILEKRALSPRSVIFLLEIEGKSILVGETPNGLVRLSEYSLDNYNNSKS